MNILLSCDDTNGIQYVQEWLEFANIPYRSHSFWDQQQQRYALNPCIENSVVIANQGLLRDNSGLEHHARLAELQQFCSRGNQLWLIGTDLALDLVLDPTLQWLQSADAVLPKSSVTCLLDAQPMSECFLNHLQNIKAQVLPVNQFMRGAPRCQAPTSQKVKSARYDYLLTTIRRPQRPHRNILWDQLHQRSGLVQRGLISNSSMQNDPEAWLGDLPAQHNYWGFHASMDLYLNCYVEIAPETCYRDLNYFTEKTQKPMMTRTPFLSVANQGYLKWLKSQGFKTFDSLIDESYDTCPAVEDRVCSMLNTLEHIVASGAEQFYLACQPILDHNFSRLCELAGSWHHQFDSVLWQLVKNFQHKQT